MQVFLEVHGEPGPEGDRALLEQVDCTGLTEQQCQDALAGLKVLYGTSCLYRQHNCHHDDGAPCELLGPL